MVARDVESSAQKNSEDASPRAPAIAPPVPSLPKGGGAVRGIGEKFSANPVTGTARVRIPLAVSPCRDLQPDVSLDYDSGAGNGVFGAGFRASTPSIARKTDKGLPHYDDARDVFVLSGAEDLVPTGAPFDDGDDTVQRFVPRVESMFARIERRKNKTTGATYFRVTSRDNVTSIYGRSTSARVAHPKYPELVFSWLIEETRDDRGNVCIYGYKPEDRANVPLDPCEVHRASGDVPTVNLHLARIRYGNTVPFDASPELDSALFELRFDYGEYDESGNAVRDWPCRKDAFSTYRAGFEIRTYRLCRRVLMVHRMKELGGDCVVRSTELTYDENPVLSKLIAATQTGWIRSDAGYTKKSLPAIELAYSPVAFSSDIATLAPMSDLPAAVSGPYQWVDLDGEALPGVLADESGTLLYKRNLGDASLAPARALLRQPNAARTHQVTDLDGDGLKEITVYADSASGYFDRTSDGDFEPFRPFVAQAFIDWNDPNLRRIDLDGDGFDDVLIARADSFTWYPSLAKDGFGAPITFAKPKDDEQGAALVFADATQTIFVADMSGDGLTDLVRIRNGSVCYWPNLGFGRFGPKVQMAGDPWFDNPERFDPKRIRLADVDGSGTTDILYLRADGIRIHANQSGNSIADAVVVAEFPDTSDMSSIATVDLLGSGTACLVWTSSIPSAPFRSLRYIDLLESKKPHLLVSYKNNFGLETTLEYAASTKFYVADSIAGKPWITRLHFPVHVLVRSEAFDSVSRHRNVSTYAYHHGYFDGVEREFRGFGMVEQWDAESFSASSGSDPELHLPPVHTKTWFHTGALTIDPYARDYWAGDALAPRLPSFLPVGLDSDNLREACRALKGQLLRQETYADDGSPFPYLVSEHSYYVRCLQPIAGGAHGSFLVHPREAIELHYERNPNDPRITHAFTLEVDEWGSILRAATVGYPRRTPAYAEQGAIAIVLTESDYANHSGDDFHRVGVPIETRAFELTGLGGALISFDAMLDAANAASAIAYEVAPSSGVQKRWLGQSRTFYWRDDLSGPLALGAIESRALPHRTWTKAFSPELVESVFAGRATDAILAEGKYEKLDADWWVPSEQRVFDASRFYLPIAFIDPFDHTTKVDYEPYALLVSQTLDPVGNVIAASYDWRTLLPSAITEPNGGRALARYDALGMIEATAVTGARGEGDTLAAPTTTLDYDLSQKPVMAHVRTRETHADASTRWQETWSYTDGMGREAMRKSRVEPDATNAPRYVGTGRTVFDNKGNPVKKYEPYFSATPAYEDEPDIVQQGVTPILRYDPLGRLVRTDFPNGTFSTVSFDPWMETHADANDNVLESAWYAARQSATPAERRAATLAAKHAHTPAVVHLDALGRPFLAIEDAGALGKFETRTKLDIEGNALTVTDARGIVAMQRRFGMGKRQLQQDSSDAGSRWMLVDAAGALLRTWDSRGFTHRALYDDAHRPTHLYVASNGSEILAERSVWGEAVNDDGYHRGRLYRHYDGAGVVTNVRFDFEGNVEESERRIAKEYDKDVDWQSIAADGTPDAIANIAEVALTGDRFTTLTKWDALKRPTSITTPDLSEIAPSYNDGALLDGVRARVRNASAWTAFVSQITYDAKRQRQSITYNEGDAQTTTDYAYDPLTFRLSRLTTKRMRDAALMQSLSYTYDPVGNIVAIDDGAQQTVYFANAVASASSAYEYDALYRLASATGRELAGGLADVVRGADDLPLVNLPHANDANAVRNYTESYGYDAVGNILSMIHNSGAAATSWTRHYKIDAASNRLLATTAPGDDDSTMSATYAHDAHGNMIAMPHLSTIAWDHRDQMKSADKGGGGTVHFTYDSAGQRVRKVWVHDGLIEERIYLGGYEVFRRSSGDAQSFERQTLHIMDGTQRIALVETVTVDSSAGGAFQPTTTIRFQLGNHLGSSVLELDESSQVLSYEEYHPYGTTAYSSGTSIAETSRKRYRYTGKERDEETSLYYHGARYYAPWLGRWTSTDPLGMADGPNLYAYVRNSPIKLSDPDGRQASTPAKADDVKAMEHLVGATKSTSFTMDQRGRYIVGKMQQWFYSMDPSAKAGNLYLYRKDAKGVTFKETSSGGYLEFGDEFIGGLTSANFSARVLQVGKALGSERQAAVYEVASTPAEREALTRQFGITIQRGNREWSHADIGDLRNGLNRLNERERGAIRGGTFTRWTAPSATGAPRSSHGAVGDESANTQLDFNPTTGMRSPGAVPLIAFFDSAFGRPSRQENVRSPQATSEGGVPAGEFIVLHEIGHVLHQTFVSLAARAAFNRISGVQNLTGPSKIGPDEPFVEAFAWSKTDPRGLAAANPGALQRLRALGFR